MSRTVLITGAAGALAVPTIDVFREAGWTLVLFVHRADRADDLRAQVPEAHVYTVDLADAEAAHAAVEAAVGVVEGLDAVLNLAGGFAMQPADAATPEDYARMMRVNFATLFYTTRAVLPVMERQGHGMVLGVAAAAAEEGSRGAALYAASKAAVVGYLKSLQAELHGTGVRVSILYPMGAIDTPANRTAMPRADPAGWIDPAELAQGLYFLATRTARGHVRRLQVYAAK